MKLRYGLIADAVTPGPGGKKNATGIFTEIWAQTFPCKHPSLSLILAIDADASDVGSHEIEISFVDADYRPQGNPVKATLEIKDGAVFMDPVLNVVNLLLRKPGAYEFVVRADGRHLGSVPLSAKTWDPTKAP